LINRAGWGIFELLNENVKIVQGKAYIRLKGQEGKSKYQVAGVKLKEHKIGVKVFTRERDASRTDPISEKSEQG